MFDCVPKTPLMPVYVGLCLLPTFYSGGFIQVLYRFHLETKKVAAGQVRQVVVL